MVWLHGIKAEMIARIFSGKASLKDFFEENTW